MNHKEVSEAFESLGINNWKISGQLPGSKKTGQAVVCEVTRTSDGQKGAFRLLHNPDATDIKRFRREVHILTSGFRHPNIINILQYSLDGLWYISELGTPFIEHWEEIKSNIPQHELPETAIKYITCILEGLIPLHEQGVVHRDIKPKNIIMVRGDPVLIDFGLVFHPEEERVTNTDSAVGNQRFSPDQMMNRMDEVPPWLDIFEISQVLIWMTSLEPTKNWSRALHWKYVKYPLEFLDEDVIAIRAITAICSEEPLSPKNARALRELITNIFHFKTVNLNQDQNRVAVVSSLKSGQAKALTNLSADMAVLTSAMEVFKHYHDTIKNRLEVLVNDYISSVPIRIYEGTKLEDWYRRLQNKDKFHDTEDCRIFEVICGVEGKARFWLWCSVIYWVPSVISRNPKVNYLPDTILPLTLEFGIGSDHNILKKHNIERNLFLGIENNGKIWCSEFAGLFKQERQQIEMVELLERLASWVTDPKCWEIVHA